MNEAGKSFEGYELNELLRRLRLKMNRIRVAKLVPVVLELNSAFDKGAFFSILDRNFCRADMDLPKRKEVCEVLINISETWGNEKPYGGQFIINDDGSIQEEPCLIDVSEEKLKLNSIRKEWLSEWFNGNNENIEGAKKVQKKTKMERSFAMGEMAMATPEAERAFKIAENKGYIIKNGNLYTWCNASFSYSLLGLFLGLLFCNDKIVIEHHQPSIQKGKDFHSASYFKRLFGGIDVGKCRRDLLNKTSYPPPGWEEIEKIVNEAKAT